MKNWKERLSAVEGNTLTPRTLAEVYGMERVLVEHHRGIQSYGEECIRIGTTYGSLEVEGEALRLGCMSRHQIVICGKIRQLRIEGSE